MKEIKLTNDERSFIVDDEDYERISKFKWFITGSGQGMIKRGNFVGRNISLSCEVKRTKNLMYDHEDRNPLNNQKSNLRQCDYSQNAQNRSKIKGTSSKYKGVYWNKQLKKWHVQVKMRDERVHVGYFESEDVAALAYNNTAAKLFGSFAHLNII